MPITGADRHFDHSYQPLLLLSQPCLRHQFTHFNNLQTGNFLCQLFWHWEKSLTQMCTHQQGIQIAINETVEIFDTMEGAGQTNGGNHCRITTVVTSSWIARHEYCIQRNLWIRSQLSYIVCNSTTLKARFYTTASQANAMKYYT